MQDAESGPGAAPTAAAARHHSIAVVADPESCTWCEACVDICPREAIMLASTAVRVDENACNGCGACVNQCPNGVLELKAV